MKQIIDRFRKAVTAENLSGNIERAFLTLANDLEEISKIRGAFLLRNDLHLLQNITTPIPIGEAQYGNFGVQLGNDGNDYIEVLYSKFWSVRFSPIVERSGTGTVPDRLDIWLQKYDSDKEEWVAVDNTNYPYKYTANNQKNTEYGEIEVYWEQGTRIRLVAKSDNNELSIVKKDPTGDVPFAPAVILYIS